MILNINKQTFKKYTINEREDMTKEDFVKKNTANFITLVRMIGTICLLFLSAGSGAFYIVYTISGVSDALDGWIARKMKLESDFGSKLDSIADLMFYAVMFIKTFPALWDVLPKTIWIAVAVILVVRVASYMVAAFKYKSFTALHTYLNKLTGALVFLLPYSLFLPVIVPHSVVTCVIALIAAVQELIIHIQNK